MLEAVGDGKARPGVVAVPLTFGSALNVYRSKKLPNGRTKRELVPRENWHAFLPDAHPGHISWGEFERIEQLLRESAKAYGADRPTPRSASRRSRPSPGPGYLRAMRLPDGGALPPSRRQTRPRLPVHDSYRAERAKSLPSHSRRQHRRGHRQACGRGDDSDGTRSGSCRLAGVLTI